MTSKTAIGRRTLLRHLGQGALALGVLAALPATALAQDPLAAAKAQGLVGERPDGLVGFVAGSVPADVRALVEQINAQRRQKYADVAASTGQSLAQVQAVAGDRLVQATPAGQFVMNAAGRWVKK